MNVKQIINNIISNKRIMYLSCTIFLLLFCIILNYTFSLFTTGANNISANITVGDLDYKMVINAVELDSTVGTKDRTNTIIGDRIILSKAGKTEQFDISLISLNNFNTKYEITYKICTNVECNNSVNKPEGIEILYNNNLPDIKGTIIATSSKNIGIFVVNSTENDYYIQIGLNVGYEHNDLVLQNQISEYFTTDYMEANLDIIAYVNGKEVTAFPTTSNFEASIVCKYNNGQTAAARGLFNYTSTGWKLDIFNIDSTPTTCRVDFEEILQVTYDILLARYNCANKQAQATDPIITYSGDCSLHQDNNNNWYMKLLTNGTLSVSGKIWLDVFLVGGGGGGGRDYYKGGNGGEGGDTYTSKNIEFLNTANYSVTIGSGGSGGSDTGNDGGNSSINLSGVILTASGGTKSAGGSGGWFSQEWGSNNGSKGADGVRSFGDSSSTDTYLYGADGGGGGSRCSPSGTNPWPGYGAAGGTTGGGGGGTGYCSAEGPTAGGNATVANVGAGGGGAGSHEGRASIIGGSGGTGVVIIRNVRS